MINPARNRTTQLAKEFIEKGDPCGWFEQLYKTADGDEKAVPWADMAVNPNLAEWLERQIAGTGKRAIVIGCGLGDDAEALSQLGFEVTAFDISPTAITWCQKRFPDSAVTYQVADLFEVPTAWQGEFDFVLESYTLQAMPQAVRDRAIPHVAALVRPSGSLLVICRGRNADEPAETVPFPLTREELEVFQNQGLQEMTFEDFYEKDTSTRRFRVHYRRAEF